VGFPWVAQYRLALRPWIAHLCLGPAPSGPAAVMFIAADGLTSELGRGGLGGSPDSSTTQTGRGYSPPGSGVPGRADQLAHRGVVGGTMTVLAHARLRKQELKTTFNAVASDAWATEPRGSRTAVCRVAGSACAHMAQTGLSRKRESLLYHDAKIGQKLQVSSHGEHQRERDIVGKLTP